MKQESEKLRVELSLAKASINGLNMKLVQKQDELEQLENIKEQQRHFILDLESRVIELEEQNKLIQQSVKEGAQLPSFLSRAQENARREIANLKSLVSDKDCQVAKLQKLLHLEQSKEYIQQAPLIEQIEILCQDLDKQKLLTLSLKKQAGQQELSSGIEVQKMRECYEQEFTDMNSRMNQMDQYIMSIVKEYQEKEAELQKTIMSQEMAEKNLKEQEKIYEILQNECRGYQERCQNLESELEIKGKQFTQKDPKIDMDVEMKKQREIFNKQIFQLKEEKQKMSQQINELQAKVKSILTDPNYINHEQEITLKDQKIKEFEYLQQSIRAMLDMPSEESQKQEQILENLQSALQYKEEYNILKQEYERILGLYEKQDANVKQFEQECINQHKQIQALQRQLQSMSSPSTFTQNLLIQRDEEISELKEKMACDRKKLVELEDKHWHAQKQDEISKIQIADCERKVKQLKNDHEQQAKEFEETKEKMKQRLEIQLNEQREALNLSSSNQIKEMDGQIQILKENEKKLIAQDQWKNQVFDQNLGQIGLKRLNELKFEKLLGVINIEQCDQSLRQNCREIGTNTQFEIIINEEKSTQKDQASTLNQKIEALQMNLASTKDQLTEAQELQVDSETDIQRLKQIIENNDDQITMLQNQGVQSDQKLNQNKEQIEVLKLEQQQLQKEIKKYQESQQILISEKLQILANQKTENKGFENNAVCSEEQIQKLNEQIQQQHKKIEKLYSQNVELTKKLEEALENQDKSENKYICQITLLNQNILENKKKASVAQEEIGNVREENQKLSENEAKLLNEAQSLGRDMQEKFIQHQKEQEMLQNQIKKSQAESCSKQKYFEETLYQKEIEFEIKEKSLQQKFQKQIQNIENEYKDGKDSLISDIYEDHKNQIEEIKNLHINAIKKLKAEDNDQINLKNQQIDEIKDMKNSEVKRVREEQENYKKVSEEKIKAAEKDKKKLSEEIERGKKSFEEKQRLQQNEFSLELEKKDFEYKDKLEALNQKLKKDVKSAQEKVKAEMKNQVDSVKNDFARQKAEWEREKKKQLQEHEDAFKQFQILQEDNQLEEIRQAKEKNEKQFKKRLQEKESLWQAKFEEIEKEITQLNGAHQIDIKNQKERIENRLKSQVQLELQKNNQDQIMESELKYQVLQEEYVKLENQLVSFNNKTEQKENQMQTDENNTQQKRLNDFEMKYMHEEITQIKQKYQENLQKAINDYKMSQENHKEIKDDVIRQFESVMNYEFEKILMSLKMKALNISQDQLNDKRNHINKLIQKILYQNKDLQMKKSMENIKRSISDVLKLFKDSLEEKSQKTINGLEKQIQQLNLKFAEEQIKNKAIVLHRDQQSSKSAEKVNAMNACQSQKKYISSNQKNDKSNCSKEQLNSLQDDEDYLILQKLEPQMINKKGQIVVEVEKVFKDLQVLYQSMKASKFFKLCIQAGGTHECIPETLFDVSSQAYQHEEESGERAQEVIVKKYRDLLNYLFKLIVKLNNGADQLQKQNEVYRLKLLNQELREQVFKQKQESAKQLTQEKVNELLQKFLSDKLFMNFLSEDALNVLSKIEQLTPNLGKLLEHQKSMVNLFTTSNQTQFYVINKNCAEINQKCQIYLEQFDNTLSQAQEIQQQASQPQFSSADFPNQESFDENDYDQPDRQDLQHYYQNSNQQFLENEEEENYEDYSNFNNDRYEFQSNQGTDQQEKQNMNKVNKQHNELGGIDKISQEQAAELVALVIKKLNIVNPSQINNSTQENLFSQNTFHIKNNAKALQMLLNQTATNPIPQSHILRSNTNAESNRNIYASQQYRRRQDSGERLLNSDIDQNDEYGDYPPVKKQNLILDETVNSQDTQQQTPWLQNKQNILHIQNIDPNEDCIRQAESLLRLIGQGSNGVGRTNQRQLQSAPNKSNNISDACERQNIMQSYLPLQNKLPTNLKNRSPQGSFDQTQSPKVLDQAINQMQKQFEQKFVNNIPKNNQRKETQKNNCSTQNFDRQGQQNFQSIDVISNISASQFSIKNQQTINYVVPPLRLNNQSRSRQYLEAPVTSKSVTLFGSNNPISQIKKRGSFQQQTSIMETCNEKQNDGCQKDSQNLSKYDQKIRQEKSMNKLQNEDSHSPDKQVPQGQNNFQLNSAQDYYKYHKNLQKNLDSKKGNEQYGSMQRIENVVSPIQSSGIGFASNCDYQSEQQSSKQLFLKPPPILQRINQSASKTSLPQNLSYKGPNKGPGLPKAQNQHHQNSGSAYTTLQHEQAVHDAIRQTHISSSIANRTGSQSRYQTVDFDNEQIDNQSAVEAPQQALTFRKNINQQQKKLSGNQMNYKSTSILNNMMEEGIRTFVDESYDEDNKMEDRDSQNQDYYHQRYQNKQNRTIQGGHLQQQKNSASMNHGAENDEYEKQFQVDAEGNKAQRTQRRQTKNSQNENISDHDNDFGEGRSCQQETIQVYASKEVSNLQNNFRQDSLNNYRRSHQTSAADHLNLQNSARSLGGLSLLQIKKKISNLNII